MSETSRWLNPLALHFQKLEFELKCTLCLNLLKKPVMLPCNHIFCNECVPGFSTFSTQCPDCQQHFTHLEIRPASHMENILAIYKSMDSTVNSAILPLLFTDSGSSASISASAGQARKKHNVTGPKGKNLDSGSSASISASAGQARKKLNVTGPKGQNLHYDVHVARGIDTSKCCVSEELDVNRASEMLPGSSPYFGGDDSRDAETPNSKLGSNRGGTKIHGTRRPVEEILDTSADELDDKDVVQTREPKRLKRLGHGLPDDISKQILVFHSNQAVISNNDEACKSKDGASLVSSVVPFDTSYINESACAFCHSSKITESSGPLQHFVDGKEVARGENDFSKAIHVHVKCIEWTPKVYFVGETIKNLKSEVARASKLKCSRCGLKGAALGCFVTSCQRSYHVPCALEISCRWDCNDFLMLCPSHKSTNFPREKSKTVEDQSEHKRSVPSQDISLQSSASKHKFWANAPTGPQEWVLCGSSLSSEDKFLLVKFASMCGAIVYKFWNPNVTHVLAAVDSNGACTRTLKVLKAILNGRWILTMDWIKACVEANGYVDEEPYEINLDNHGSRDGAKTGRLRASNNDPKLFHGLSFCFNGDFIPSYKSDLIDLVQAGGGIVVDNTEPRAEQKHDQHRISATFVVYNNDLPQGSMSNEATVFERLSEATEVAIDLDAQVIPHARILESIAVCRVLPVP